MKQEKSNLLKNEKICTCCNKRLLITVFYKKGSEGFESRCKKCVLKTKKKTYIQKNSVKKKRSAFQISEYSVSEVFIPVADEKETSSLNALIEAVLCQKRK